MSMVPPGRWGKLRNTLDMDISWVMGVPRVITHFRLGFSLNTPALLGVSLWPRKPPSSCIQPLYHCITHKHPKGLTSKRNTDIFLARAVGHDPPLDHSNIVDISKPPVWYVEIERLIDQWNYAETTICFETLATLTRMVCVHILACIYANIYIYIHAGIHTYIIKYAYPYIYIYTCMRLHT